MRLLSSKIGRFVDVVQNSSTTEAVLNGSYGTGLRLEWQVIFGLLPGRPKHLVIGIHDKELVLTLPWDTVMPPAEVRDGPRATDAPIPRK